MCKFLTAKRLLLSLLLLVGLSPAAYSACSPYVGLATLNEYYHDNQSPTNANNYFVETKLLESSMRSKYKSWSLLICSQAAADKLANGCITGDWNAASAFADTGYDADLSLNYATGGNDWLVLDQNAGVDGYAAGYVDNNGGSGHGMEVFLLDENGDVIDYTSVDGYSVHRGDLGAASCSYPYDNTYSGSNTFTMQRLPDGMGCWPEDPAITSDTTINGSAINCIGATPPSGSSGSPTEETPNTATSAVGTYPTISIQPTTVPVGGIATFSVTISGALIISKDKGSLVYTYDTNIQTVSTDITFTVSTMDGNVAAPAASVTTAQILAGSNAGTFTVDTSTISPAPVAGDYFYGVIGISTLDTSGAIINTPNGRATFTVAGVDHLSITPLTAASSTCSPVTVTVSARDASDALVTDYSGTITLSTSTNNGTWLSTTGGGTFAPGASDGGSASYTFVAADGGTASFELGNQHSETLAISASDAAEPLTTVSGDYSFSDNMFVVKDDGIRVAGRPIAVTVEFWTMERDALGNPILDAIGNPAGCSLVSNYNSAAQNLKAYLTLDGDHPAAAILPSVGGTTLPTSLPAAANVTLDFSAGGTANLALDTFDVGKYSLTLVDDSGSYSPDVTVSGSSAVMTVNPFALTLTAYAGAISNTGGTAAGGAAFVSAATPFSADIKGVLWQGADDANNDGIRDAGADLSDNSPAPAFAWATTLNESATYTPVTPTGVKLTGTLAVPAVIYSGGNATVSDLKYAEVGSFTLNATASNYLNSAGNTLTAEPLVVGRFFPDYLTLTGAVITPACGSSFSYLGQGGVGLQAAAEAFNADGVTVTLYDNLLGYNFTATLDLSAEEGDNGINLSPRISGITPLSWTGGKVVDINQSLQLTRGAAPEQFGALQLGGNFTGGDGEQLRTADLDVDPDTAGPCASCTFLALDGPQDFRYGRLALQNAFGSELLDLAVPLTTQYFDATSGSFVTNNDDGCSSVASVALNADIDPADGLDAGETCVQDSGDPLTDLSGADACPAAAPGGEAFVEPAVSGDFNLFLQAPGAGNQGIVGITATPDAAWLQFDWDGDGVLEPLGDDAISAIATFGIYQGPDSIIYMREP